MNESIPKGKVFYSLLYTLEFNPSLMPQLYLWKTISKKRLSVDISEIRSS